MSVSEPPASADPAAGHPAPARGDLLAAVDRSPEAAAAHDRSAWVGLFADDGQIEDPVGSAPHRGHDRIGRFYDTFIGPRDIAFGPGVDVVHGCTVVRDLTLHVTMGAALTMAIPAYLRYDLTPVPHGYAITRLRAHWELPSMVLEFARGGIASVRPGLGLGRGLLRNQGPAGAVGFASGFRRAGAGRRRQVTDLLDDACAGNEVAVRRRLSGDVPVTVGDGDRISASDLAARLRGGRWQKAITAGSTVTAGVEVDGQRGVLFTDVGSGSGAVGAVRLFIEDR
ncbi:MAG: nuclear transport factor 2 [Mycobacterium sp.]|nr:nuclear transport factor 2 [Mycobacterium sp.]